jgi:hypothetical protein
MLLRVGGPCRDEEDAKMTFITAYREDAQDIYPPIRMGVF